MPKPEDPVKTTVYVERAQIRRLRAVLAAEGRSVSGWLREQIDRFLSSRA